MNTSATLEITNATIADNSAGGGGGYAAMVSPKVKGTIFDDNTPQNCATVGINDQGWNIDSGNSCLVNTGVGSLKNTDPLLESLANNGGPTETFALETSPSVSPAIGLIPVAIAPTKPPTPQPLGTDQRLFARPDPGNPNACDSGAYEVGALLPFVMNSERLQIARSSTANSDHVNIGFTFTDNGDRLAIWVWAAMKTRSIPASVSRCLRAPVPVPGQRTESVSIHLWCIRSITSNMELCSKSPPETISARMVALPTPVSACGAWTLNLEVAGLNTNSATVNLGGGNPFALVLTDDPGRRSGLLRRYECDRRQPDRTPGHGVRRGVRRQGRR